MKKQVWMCALSALIGWGALSVAPAYAEDGKFVAVEAGGAKFWLGGGDIDLRSGISTAGPITFKLINKMDADHGFAIDGMGVKQVVKPGEEVTVTVLRSDLAPGVSVFKYYCHLHAAHVGGSLLVLR